MKIAFAIIAFGLLVIVATEVICRALVVRGLSRSFCLSCGQRFGMWSAFRNRIVIRFIHVTPDGIGALFRTPLALSHGRELECPQCGTISIIDALGNDCAPLLDDIVES